MRELIRRWLGQVEAEEDTVEAVARLHLRVHQLEHEVQRLSAERGGHVDELHRKRFMREWMQRNDPNGQGIAP